jgi:signal transduction histidine kinase
MRGRAFTFVGGVFLALVLWLAAGPEARAAEPAPAARAPRVVRVGVLTDNFPYSFRDDSGEIRGFAYDLIHGVEDVMGLRIERVIGSTEEIRAAFAAGRIDVLQSYAQFPERDGEADFSVPYITMSGSIIVRDGERGIQTVEDLRGRQVLVHRGSLGESVLVRAGLAGSVVHVDSVQQSLVKLAAGEGDATLATRLSALSLAQHLGLKSLRPLDVKVPGYEVRYCVAVRKGDHELLAQVNEGLAILVRTGRFDTIYQKWFGHLEPGKYSAVQVLAAVAVGLAIALVVAVWSAIKQRRLRQRLQEQEEQLRRKQKIEAVGTLARGVAHDFNNLLTAIMGNLELSLMGLAPDHPEAEGLRVAHKASVRARDLVGQILAFSRQSAPRREVVALPALVDETVNLLRTLARGAVTFESSLPADLPPVLADPAQVHQVLMNLGTNAVQAMRGAPGRLTFAAEVLAVGPDLREPQAELVPGRYVRVSVQDNGPGMPEEVRARVFEPFFTTKPTGEGTGLGLSVVHGIMEQHGGAVTVYSHPGRGTRFSLYFPAAPAEASPVPAGAASAPRGAGEHVLLVDDDAAVVDTGRKMLERLGYRVSAYTRARAALAEYRARPEGFALVLSDLTMPEMTGLQLLAGVQAIRPGQAVLLCSGIFTDAERQQAAAHGVEVFLVKPLNLEVLGAAVARALRRG